ncbi:MAG TPA: biotin/lipoyl-binding protein [Jatrophihabitantaceae bacterium]|jgi:macrolide-specific efflux system membrane fusion protein
MTRTIRRHPWISGVIAVLVLTGAGLGTYFGVRDDKAAAADATTTVETVNTGTIRQTVSATGTLAPANQEDLNFSVSGQVTKVSVSEGQHVKKGQALATINSASLSAAVAEAQASVASDQARLDDDNSNSASDTQIAADQAALTAAQNQLDTAQQQLDSATLTSPIDGIVASLNLTVGQSVSGSSSGSNNGNNGGNGNNNGNNNSSDNSSNSSSSDPQILVISTSSWIVNASVDANSVGLIKVGNQAQLSVTGVSDTVYGTIASIGLVSSSSSSSGTASYPVVVDVTGTPSGMHDGADVTATLIYKQLSNVLVVPTLALHRDASGTYVEQVKNGKTVHTAVRPGIESGGQTQIVSGLSAGAQIVVPQVSNGNGNRNGNGTNGRNGQFPGGGNFPGGGRFQLPGGGGGFVIPGGGNGGG